MCVRQKKRAARSVDGGDILHSFTTPLSKDFYGTSVAKPSGDKDSLFPLTLSFIIQLSLSSYIFIFYQAPNQQYGAVSLRGKRG